MSIKETREYFRCYCYAIVVMYATVALYFSSTHAHSSIENNKKNYLAETLVLEPRPLESGGAVAELVLEAVYHLAVLAAAHARVLYLLAVRLDLLAQLVQRLDLAC